VEEYVQMQIELANKIKDAEKVTNLKVRWKLDLSIINLEVDKEIKILWIFFESTASWKIEKFLLDFQNHVSHFKFISNLCKQKQLMYTGQEYRNYRHW
jgi:hypothetical protein